MTEVETNSLPPENNPDDKVAATPSYPKTPVDCLISELRDMFTEHRGSLISRQQFEKRVVQFKEEVRGGTDD